MWEEDQTSKGRSKERDGEGAKVGESNDGTDTGRDGGT